MRNSQMILSRLSFVPNVRLSQRKSNVSAEPETEKSFWFNRADDEPFIDDFDAPTQDKGLRASKNYADFIAASTNVSLKSFRSYRGFNDMSYGSSIGSKFTAPEYQAKMEPVSYQEWLWGKKITLFLSVYFLAAVVFMVLYLAPAVYIEDNTLECVVQDADIFSVDCPGSDKGFCVQQEVIVNVPSSRIRVIAPLQGGKRLTSLDSDESLSCQYISCFSDEDSSNRILQDEDEEAAFSDAEGWANSTLASSVNCIYLTPETSWLHSRFYKAELENGGTQVSTIKGPKRADIVAAVGVVFGVFAALIVGVVVFSFYHTISTKSEEEDTRFASASARAPVRSNPVAQRKFAEMNNNGPWKQNAKIRQKLA